MTNSKYAILLIFALSMFSCADDDYTPKPKAYPKIEFPEKGYQLYSSESCPFSFEHPAYSYIRRDSILFDQLIENPCWLDVSFDDFSGKIHLSYKRVSNLEDLRQLLDDAHKLTYKHYNKADYIEEIPLDNQNGVVGLLYAVGGDAASNIQFYLTDAEEHFIRGALYFRVAPNSDSLAPVVQFVRDDMEHMFDTFRWTD